MAQNANRITSNNTDGCAAHHWGQVLVFGVKTCLHGRAFTRNKTRLTVRRGENHMDIMASEVMKQKNIPIFCCYAHEDEALLNKLKAQLKPLQREGLIDTWHDRDISAGSEWEIAIHEQLDAAQIILLLVSPDFMNSDYCYSVEMKRALERHVQKEACVIPIILRPVYWQGAPFSKLQMLPTDAKPVTTWHNQDEAFLNITRGIRTKIPFQKDSDKFSASHWFSRLRHVSCPLCVLLLSVVLSLLAIALLFDQIVIARTIFPETGISLLEYHDLLNNANNMNTEKEKWDIDNRCFFASDGYHIDSDVAISCIEQGVKYKNSSISVNMIVLSRNPAGLMFRNQRYGGYYFEVSPNPCTQEVVVGTSGCYHLSILGSSELHQWTPSPAIRTKGQNFLIQISIVDHLILFIIY